MTKMTDKELIETVNANAEKMRADNYSTKQPKWLKFGLRISVMPGQESETLQEVMRGPRRFSRGVIGEDGKWIEIFYDLAEGSTAVAVRDPWECKASRLYQVVDESLFSQ